MISRAIFEINKKDPSDSPRVPIVYASERVWNYINQRSHNTVNQEKNCMGFYNQQLFTEVEVNSGGCLPSGEAVG